jgi:hypothetical protein
VGWATLIGVGLTHLAVLGPGLDPWLFVMHVLSIVAYVGGAGALCWAAYVAWRCGRPWTPRVWTTLLAVSGLILLWTAWVHHLMSFRATY